LCDRDRCYTIMWSMSTLGRYLNLTVFVAAPSIFGDADARSCVLAGIDGSGLWLNSHDWPFDPEHAEAVFVPFTQILYLRPANGEPAGFKAERRTEASVHPAKGLPKTGTRKKKSY
jgi:hypothetical protein